MPDTTSTTLDESTTVVPGTGGPTTTDTSSPTTTATTSPTTTTTTTAPPAGPTRPAVAVAVSEQNRLVVLDTATGEALRVLDQRETSEEDAGTNEIVGVTLSDDGRSVLYAVTGHLCDTDRIYRVAIDGGEPEELGNGLSPAVSPDGRSLAYARSNDPTMCSDELVVRDLTTGEERMWPPAQDGYEELANLLDLTWAADSRTLAFERSYEGSEVLVVDTAGEGGFERPAGEPGDAVGCSRSPAWASDGGLSYVAYTDLFCGDDELASEGDDDLLVVARAGEEGTERPLPPGGRVRADATGEHLLHVVDGRIVILGDGEGDEVLGTGFVDADW